MIAPAEFRKTIRSIALPFVFPSIGLMTAFLLKKGCF